MDMNEFREVLKMIPENDADSIMVSDESERRDIGLEAAVGSNKNKKNVARMWGKNKKKPKVQKEEC